MLPASIASRSMGQLLGRLPGAARARDVPKAKRATFDDAAEGAWPNLFPG